MNRLSNFLRLCKHHFRLGSSALLAVLSIRLLLWIVPYRHLHRRFAGPRGRVKFDQVRQRRIAAAVRLAARLIPAASCLTQALATKLLLRLRGEDSALCFGVARAETGAFQAHAWLETEGQVLIGQVPDLDRYRKMAHPDSVS